MTYVGPQSGGGVLGEDDGLFSHGGLQSGTRCEGCECPSCGNWSSERCGEGGSCSGGVSGGHRGQHTCEAMSGFVRQYRRVLMWGTRGWVGGAVKTRTVLWLRFQWGEIGRLVTGQVCWRKMRVKLRLSALPRLEPGVLNNAPHVVDSLPGPFVRHTNSKHTLVKTAIILYRPL